MIMEKGVVRNVFLELKTKIYSREAKNTYICGGNRI